MQRSDKENSLAENKVEEQLTLAKPKVAGAAEAAPQGKWNDDILNHVAELLPTRDVMRMASVCRLFFHGTRQVHDQRTLEQLAHFVVVEPNEEKVKLILNNYPILINAIIPVVTDKSGPTNSSGRILLNNTILQLAYGAGNYEMCLVIKPFFIKVYGSKEAGIAEMVKQLKEKFAESKEEEEEDKQATTQLAGMLTSIVAAITQEQFNNRDADDEIILSVATEAAIATFKKEFSKSQPQIIKKGMHFRDQTVLETLKAYAQAVRQWNHDYNKDPLFKDAILCFVLTYMPARALHEFNQHFYYPLDAGHVSEVVRDFQGLCLLKKAKLEELMQASHSELSIFSRFMAR